MYCRMCGNKLEDMDHYCQHCGTPTGHIESSGAAADETEIKEEIVFNPPYESPSHFQEEKTLPDVDAEEPFEPDRSEKEEDLKEFISENEIEAQKQEEEGDQAEKVRSSEFSWNLYEFPAAKSKKSEEIEFNWNLEEFGKPESKDDAEAAFEEALFQEIREESTRIKEQNIDRFFTFSRKNEEFQKLLDKEYEKFKMRSGPVSEQEIESPTAQDTQIQNDVPEEAHYQETPLDTEVPSIIEIPIDEETEIQEIEAAPETETGPVAEARPADAKAEHISEMAMARAQFFGEELVRDNDSIRKKLETVDPAESGEGVTPEELHEQELLIEPEDLTEPAEQHVPEESQNSSTEENLERAYEALVAAGELEKEEEGKKKRSVAQILLIIIAIILAAEIIILGIRYLAPESAASKSISAAQTQIIKTVSGWFDTTGASSEDGTKGDEATPDGNDEDTSKDGTDQEEESADGQTAEDGKNAPAPDPNPAADKNALVASQLGNNKNIQQVKANETLVYQAGKDYGESDINNSKPITNNIWINQENGDPIYYDRSVVGTIIAFDSQWIDYVNDGSKSVLELLKKDSRAYKNAASFSKIGKIEETFKLLEIGEIRQGTNGFYVWVHEELQITDNGSTADKKYNWIYYLEPVEGKMQIVNYFKF